MRSCPSRGVTYRKTLIFPPTNTANPMSKMLMMVCLVLLCFSLAAFTDEPLTGKEIYKKKCQRCHGEKGGKGISGAKNLQISHMKYEDIINLITNGKKPMPAFKAKLTPEEISLVANYATSLRTY